MKATYQEITMVRLWLANALERVARWRESKAEEYPDDVRNVRSANALHQAVMHVRITFTPNVSRVVEQLAELVVAARESDLDLTSGVAYLPTEAQRVAGRYFFDVADSSEPPNEQTHEALIVDIFDACIRDVAAMGAAKDSPVAELLRARAGADGREERSDESRVPRVQQLYEVTRVLVSLADAARAEAGPDDRLPQLFQPTKVPLLRKQLRIALDVLVAFRGPRIETAEKLVNEPADHATPIWTNVLLALDEVEHAVAGEPAQTPVVGST